MKKYVALLATLLAGLAALALWLRVPPVEPFEPTAREAEQLRFYRQPQAWFALHLQKPPIVVDGQRLDPKLQYFLTKELGALADAAPWQRWLMTRFMDLMFATPRGRAKLRAQFDRNWLLYTKADVPLAKVQDRWIEARGGRLHIRLYHPFSESSDPLSVLVYAHGGGYLLGSLAGMDRAVRLMAQQSGAIVISIDYRLAPEHPYPAAADDGEDAFLWARSHAQQFGGDPGRVAAGGDSAGGQIAVNIAQRLLARGESPPAALLLYYPALALPLADRSYRLFGKGYGLDASFFEFLLPRVFPHRRLEDPRDDFIEPLHAKRLAGLPPTILAGGGFDVLRDSELAFCRRLHSEGVSANCRIWPNLTHNFLQLSGIIEDAERATVEPARLLARQLRQPMPAR